MRLIISNLILIFKSILIWPGRGDCVACHPKPYLTKDGKMDRDHMILNTAVKQCHQDGPKIEMSERLKGFGSKV